MVSDSGFIVDDSIIFDADSGLAAFPDERPAVMVVSHERSGTHFLMNALAGCYGYVSAPWVNLDRPDVNINFFHPPEIARVLHALADRRSASIVKSHHPADFFAGELPGLAERYVIFVIYRDPVSTMVSFWRLLHAWEWLEGPKTPDPVSFARAEPCGRLMRYQIRQFPSMLHRWAAHVESWLAAAAEFPQVVPVCFEDLDTRYHEIMRSFAPRLERLPQADVRPARDVNVIPGGPEDPTGSGVKPDIESLRRLCREIVGPTMARLGYD